MFLKMQGRSLARRCLTELLPFRKTLVLQRHLRTMMNTSRSFSKGTINETPLNSENKKQMSLITKACILLALSLPPLYAYYYYRSRDFARRVKESYNAGYGKSLVKGEFNLVDVDGNPVTDKHFKNKFTLVYFGYTFCPDVCPQELEKVTEALDLLKTEGIDNNILVPIFVSCDTKRDSLTSIKEYLQDFHPSFVGLSGTPNQVKKSAKSFRIYFSSPPEALDDDNADYIVDHSTFTYFMDQDMEYIAHFSILDTPYTIADAVCKVIKGYPFPKKLSGKE